MPGSKEKSLIFIPPKLIVFLPPQTATKRTLPKTTTNKNPSNLKPKAKQFGSQKKLTAQRSDR